MEYICCVSIGVLFSQRGGGKDDPGQEETVARAGIRIAQLF